MRVLAFDTATSATAVGLLRDGDAEPLEAIDDPGAGRRPRHTPQLLALARSLLDRAGLTLADVDRIVVGTGPGSFTGLRIGVATARALAQATGAELAGVSTLRVLAVAADGAASSQDPPALVLPVLDARRGEVFAAAWDGAEEVLAPRALRPEALAELAVERGAGSPRSWLAVGDGALRFKAQLTPAGVTVPAPGSPLHRVSPTVLCRLGAEAEPAPRDAVVPDYLRLPDAELRVRSEHA